MLVWLINIELLDKTNFPFSNKKQGNFSLIETIVRKSEAFTDIHKGENNKSLT